MKFTSEDLMEAMGLQVGDRVEVEDKGLKGTFDVTKDYGLFRLDHVPIHNARIGYELYDILGLEYKILPRPKRVGDLKCGECSCTTCQLRGIGCMNISINAKNTLYEILDKYFEEYPDQEIYDLLKVRLDKEVKEEDKAKELFKWRVKIGEYGEGIADGWVYANSIIEAENKVKKHYTNCYHNVEIDEDYDPSNDKDVMCGLEDYKKYDNDVFVRWED